MKLIPLLLAAPLFCASSFGTTLAVLPGESIQAKVDAAAPGDIVAIFGGTYPGDVTVNKAIRLVEVDGQDVTITGNVTFIGIANSPPFEGFAVGSSGKGITVTNTTGLIIKNCDARGGFGINVNGASKLGITGGFTGNVVQNGGELTVSFAVTGSFVTLVGSQKTVCFRSNSSTVDWNSQKAYLGYSRATSVKFSGSNSKFVAVRAIVEFPPNTYGTAMDLQGTNNKFQILNCDLIKIRWGNGNGGERFGRGVAVQAGNETYILNNYIEQASVDTSADFHGGTGVSIQDSRSIICNNIFIGSNWAVAAPYGAVVANNLVYGQVRGTNRPTNPGGDAFGVVPTDWVLANPLLISGQEPLLQAGSPCINAGKVDAIFNDFDGSRNDIGPGGGCLFDPAGWTTSNPVVVSFDLVPQQLLKGVDTQVTISNGQAVSQP